MRAYGLQPTSTIAGPMHASTHGGACALTAATVTAITTSSLENIVLFFWISTWLFA